jgi:hypothetical protein
MLSTAPVILAAFSWLRKAVQAVGDLLGLFQDRQAALFQLVEQARTQREARHVVGLSLFSSGEPVRSSSSWMKAMPVTPW